MQAGLVGVCPEWISTDAKALTAKILMRPEREQLDQSFKRAWLSNSIRDNSLSKTGNQKSYRPALAVGHLLFQPFSLRIYLITLHICCGGWIYVRIARSGSFAPDCDLLDLRFRKR